MGFRSILFQSVSHAPRTEVDSAPEFFTDLNLDTLVEWITAGKDEYGLKPLFYLPLEDVAEIEYRHDVMRELEKKEVFDSISEFTQKLRLVRKGMEHANQRYSAYQKQWWFLDAAEVFWRAVRALLDSLNSIELDSRGFANLRAYLTQYAASERFTSLVYDSTQLKSELSEVQYCFIARGDSVTVRHFEDEANYGIEVEKTFEKFAQARV